MPTFSSFASAVLPWQNFYLLTGEAAATLVGLMFVAVTFGASMVTEETASLARAFLDPTLTHFIQVLFTACVLTIPILDPRLLGAFLLVMCSLRLATTVRVYRQMKRATQRPQHDIELADWLSGIVFPVVCYLLLGVTGVAFTLRCALAFDGLAIATLGTLVLGVYGAWEMLVWMAIVRSRQK